jgi:AraC-like DNA-binding protein
MNVFRLEELTAWSDFSIRDQTNAIQKLEPHRHEYLQIQLNLLGETRHWLNGVSLPVGPGTLSFVAPYRVHLIPHVPGGRYLVINVTHRFLRPDLQLDALDLDDVSLEIAPELAPFIYQDDVHFQMSGARLDEAHELCRQMALENQSRTLCSVSRIRSLLTLLLLSAIAPYEARLAELQKRQVHVTRRRQWLQRVISFMRENLHRQISLADAAQAAHLSPTYLSNVLKKETGKTFIEMLTERRMEKARELLLSTSIRMTEIAEAVGFEDEAYFARRFKQRYGKTPTEMRTALLSR